MQNKVHEMRHAPSFPMVKESVRSELPRQSYGTLSFSDNRTDLLTSAEVLPGVPYGVWWFA